MERSAQKNMPALAAISAPAPANTQSSTSAQMRSAKPAHAPERGSCELLQLELAVAPESLASFRHKVLHEGRRLYRDLPWRRSRDPYGVLVSEIMLQQTQVSRVLGRWERWLERFPTLEVLAEAPRAEVLQEWQGLGYNRRALALHQAAQALARAGAFPREVKELQALPGIGPATAAGVRAFAFNLPSVYVETNVRTVFLHELFPKAQKVRDRELIPYVRATCPKDAANPADDPRTWYYALLDMGANLKRQGSKAHRRASATTRQGRFEGSRRQKRAQLVRLLLAAREGAEGPLATHELERRLGELETAQGRPQPSYALVESILQDLAKEGFCQGEKGTWWC